MYKLNCEIYTINATMMVTTTTTRYGVFSCIQTLKVLGFTYLHKKNRLFFTHHNIAFSLYNKNKKKRGRRRGTHKSYVQLLLIIERYHRVFAILFQKHFYSTCTHTIRYSTYKYNKRYRRFSSILEMIK